MSLCCVLSLGVKSTKVDLKTAQTSTPDNERRCLNFRSSQSLESIVWTMSQRNFGRCFVLKHMRDNVLLQQPEHYSKYIKMLLDNCVASLRTSVSFSHTRDPTHTHTHRNISANNLRLVNINNKDKYMLI